MRHSYPQATLKTCCSQSKILISSAGIRLFSHNATFSAYTKDQGLTRKPVLSTLHLRMTSCIKRPTVVFFSSVILSWVSCSVYNELRDLGISCYPRDSCQCSSSNLDVSKSCECDTTCYRRETCCIDSPYVDFRPSTRNEMCSSEQIIGINRYFYFTSGPPRYFQIGNCEKSWSGSTEIRGMCEMENPVDGVDFMFAIPVTNVYTGITYRNYYCALCNNGTEGSVLWDFIIYADGDEVSDRFTVQSADETSITAEESQEGSNACSGAIAVTLVFNKENGYYGYWDYCSSDTPRFVQTVVMLSIPDQIQHLVISCRADLVSSCPPDWTDVRVKTLCESYLGVIESPPKINRYGINVVQSFRNAHCALCNNVTNFEGYSCAPFFALPVITPAYPMSYTVIFGHPLSDSKCLKNNEKYFEELGGCRPVICREKVKNGKCTS